MARALIHMPATAKRGEVIEIRALIGHPMETGYRMDNAGKSIARNVIRSFTCRYNGTPVFSARLSSGIAANPYLRFFITAADSGELVFEWVDDAGARGTDRASITVA